MANTVDLDSPQGLAAGDPSGMLGVIERFPSQVVEALEIGAADVTLPPAEGVTGAVVLGMGGSGVSGDFVASLFSDALPFPVTTCKGYRLPAFVDGNTLVFAVSYSGNTEETLACLEQALERGARIVAVTSGGVLAERACEAGFPVFEVPGGLQPRASLGYLFVPLAAALERMGLGGGVLAEVEGAFPMLEARSREYGAESPVDHNPTKHLAKELVGYLPVVYGSEGPPAVAAMRWKTQLNENGKVPAFYHWFPELNHNETVGWLHTEEIWSRCHLIVLREEGEHPRVSKRIEITPDLIQENVGRITQVCARGANKVERLLDLVYFGDFVSVYLALLLGEDPTPVARIAVLKDRLAEDPG